MRAGALGLPWRWPAREVLRVQRDPVRLKNESGDLKISWVAQAARVARRHLGADVTEELADALAAPLRGEGGSLDGRRKLAVVQIRAMAAGAVLRIGRLAFGGLSAVKRRRSLGLAAARVSSAAGSDYCDSLCDCMCPLLGEMPSLYPVGVSINTCMQALATIDIQCILICKEILWTCRLGS